MAVITLVAVLGGFAFSKLSKQAKEDSAKRNAQIIAATSAAAYEVGAYHVIPETVPNGGVLNSIKLLRIVGVTSDEGMKSFDLPISKKQVLAAAKYLEIIEIRNPDSCGYILDYRDPSAPQLSPTALAARQQALSAASL